MNKMASKFIIQFNAMLSLLRDNYKGLENIFECLKTFKNILEPFSLHVQVSLRSFF